MRIHMNITWSWLYFCNSNHSSLLIHSNGLRPNPPPLPFPHIVTFSAHLAYLHSISPSLTVGLPAYFNNTNHIPCACRLYSTFWRSKWHRKYGRHLRSVPLLHWNWRLCTGYSQPIHYREKGEKIILSTGGVSKIAGKKGEQAVGNEELRTDKPACSAQTQ